MAIVVASLAIPAHLAVMYALLARPDRVVHERTVEDHQEHTVTALPPLPVAPPAPLPVAAPRACPAPNRHATNRAAPAMATMTGVYASPTNVDWIATWNEASVQFSSDGGRTFHEVLAGTGRVHSVAIDCFGHVIAARGTQVGIRDGQRETWRDVPGIDLADRDLGSYPSAPPEVWIVGGGPEVVVVGFQAPFVDNRSRVARSRDLGRTWSYHDLTDGGFEGSHFAGRQLADGHIDLELEIVDCGGEWMETVTIDGGVVKRTDGPNPPESLTEGLTTWRARLVTREPWRDVDGSTDAAGRRWVLACGQLQLASAKAPSCTEEEDAE